MQYLYVIVFAVFMLLFWFSNFFNIPGNWLNVLLMLVWKLIFSTFSWYFWFLIFFIALFGEGLEFYFQWWVSKRYGGTKKGNIGSFIGAIAGAIIGAPFLLGIGAILGSVVGAFLGSLVFELLSQRKVKEALVASKGAAFGKALGFSVKSGLGMSIVVLSIIKIWP